MWSVQETNFFLTQLAWGAGVGRDRRGEGIGGDRREYRVF